MRKFISAIMGNIGLKITALLIACFIWLFVTNSNDPVVTQLFNNVPITIVNEDAVAGIGKVALPEDTGTVTIKVTERQSVLRRLSRTGGDFAVTADMRNLNDMNSVPLTVTSSNPAVTWDEIEMSPSSLKVSLEDKVEQEFQVSVQSTGSPEVGKAIGKTEVLEGKTIKIAGPQSKIKIIGQVTAPIMVAGMQEDSTLESVLKVTDKNGDSFSDSDLSLLEFKDVTGTVLTDHHVNVAVGLWDVNNEVKLKVETSGTPAQGYHVAGVNVVPETVSVAGSDIALQRLGNELEAVTPVDVDGASENVSAQIDLTDTMADYENLKLLSDEDPVVNVEVVIEKSGDLTYTIPLESLEVSNRPENMKLVITPADAISVSVHSDTANMMDLRLSDIKASVDLKECKNEGTYEIPVEITLPEGYELNQEVSLTIVSTKQPAAAGDAAEASTEVD